MSYTVTRQIQWPDGHHVVEISKGGIDYTNPDALSPQFTREMEEIFSPVEAVHVAIKIAKEWQKRLMDEDINVLIAVGATGGMTLPFEGEPLTEETFDRLRKWAEEREKELPHCDYCGGLIEGEGVKVDDDRFCRETCMEMYYGSCDYDYEEEEE